MPPCMVPNACRKHNTCQTLQTFTGTNAPFLIPNSTTQHHTTHTTQPHQSISNVVSINGSDSVTAVAGGDSVAAVASGDSATAAVAWQNCHRCGSGSIAIKVAIA